MPRCPGCKEQVSPFAAGCSICGTDLEAARRQADLRRARRPSLPSLGISLPGHDLAGLAIASLLTLAMPVFGILLAGWMVHTQRLGSQRPLRIALWVLIAVGLLFLVSPGTRYGILLAAY